MGGLGSLPPCVVGLLWRGVSANPPCRWVVVSDGVNTETIARWRKLYKGVEHNVYDGGSDNPSTQGLSAGDQRFVGTLWIRPPLRSGTPLLFIFQWRWTENEDNNKLGRNNQVGAAVGHCGNNLRDFTETNGTVFLTRWVISWEDTGQAAVNIGLLVVSVAVQAVVASPQSSSSAS
jgi:hypothetical protein